MKWSVAVAVLFLLAKMGAVGQNVSILPGAGWRQGEVIRLAVRSDDPVELCARLSSHDFSAGSDPDKVAVSLQRALEDELPAEMADYEKDAWRAIVAQGLKGGALIDAPGPDASRQQNSFSVLFDANNKIGKILEEAQTNPAVNSCKLHAARLKLRRALKGRLDQLSVLREDFEEEIVASPDAEDKMWMVLRSRLYQPDERSALLERLREAAFAGQIDLAEFTLTRPRDFLLPGDPAAPEDYIHSVTQEIDALTQSLPASLADNPEEGLQRMVDSEQMARRAGRRLPLIAKFGSESKQKAISEEVWKATRRLDLRNQELLREYLHDHNWFSDDYSAYLAWLVAQHADGDISLQREVLDALRPAYDSGGDGGRLYAMLSDRIARNEGRKQTFGTQGDCADGTWQPFELKMPHEISVLRQRAGLPPLNEYKAKLSEQCK